MICGSSETAWHFQARKLQVLDCESLEADVKFSKQYSYYLYI